MRSRLFLLCVLGIIGCSDAPRPDAGTPLDAEPADARQADGGGVDAARTYVPEPFTPTPDTIAYCVGHDDAAIEQRITTMLATLTPAEKLQMLAGASAALTQGTWLVRGNARVGAPGLHMLDGPRGVSGFTTLSATAFPVAMMRGATWDPELERRVGVAMAREFRSVGADVALAPTINILRHPRWGRAQETYSEDTHHLGEFGVAFIEGLQSGGVMASVKHFAANSIEDTRHDVDVRMDERTLREVYLPHFRRAVVEAHAASVMSAYNQVNGQYCDLNTHLLTDILKGEWGFAGFVESDWYQGTHGDVTSLRAGLDIEMPVMASFEPLMGALTRGELAEAEVDTAVRRVLRAQLCFGLETRMRVRDDPSQRATPEHLALIREVARRGIVLVRNERPDGAAPTAPRALPIDASRTQRIVVLGRHADTENTGDASGSSQVKTTEVVTALEGLRARAGAAITVAHLPGDTLDAAAEATVRAADVVVIVTGLDTRDEGESDIGAGDRSGLGLRAEEEALIRRAATLNPRVVVVLEGGAALTTSGWDAEVEAVLYAFYPGAEGGNAIADILFGDVSPSGRLPFSEPVREADLPPFDNVSLSVQYGYFHGYRHLQHERIAPHHAFGFGLTYSSFSYSDLRLAAGTVARDGTVEASVTITNSGTVRARETVQLYVATMGSRVMRAEQDLRAFTQVELAPSEVRTVTLRVPVSELGFWDEAAARFEVEALSYEARVGPNAEDTPLRATFTVSP